MTDAQDDDKLYVDCQVYGNPTCFAPTWQGLSVPNRLEGVPIAIVSLDQ